MVSMIRLGLGVVLASPAPLVVTAARFDNATGERKRKQQQGNQCRLHVILRTRATVALWWLDSDPPDEHQPRVQNQSGRTPAECRRQA